MDQQHLDCCDVIYHEPAKNNLGRVLSEKIKERLQYRAALVVSGAWKGSNRTMIYEELGWESLSDRWRSRRIHLLHRIVNHATILSEEAPPNLQSPARPGPTPFFLMLSKTGT